MVALEIVHPSAQRAHAFRAHAQNHRRRFKAFAAPHRADEIRVVQPCCDAVIAKHRGRRRDLPASAPPERHAVGLARLLVLAVCRDEERVHVRAGHAAHGLQPQFPFFQLGRAPPEFSRPRADDIVRRPRLRLVRQETRAAVHARQPDRRVRRQPCVLLNHIAILKHAVYQANLHGAYLVRQRDFRLLTLNAHVLRPQIQRRVGFQRHVFKRPPVKGRVFHPLPPQFRVKGTMAADRFKHVRVFRRNLPAPMQADRRGICKADPIRCSFRFQNEKILLFQIADHVLFLLRPSPNGRIRVRLFFISSPRPGRSPFRRPHLKTATGIALCLNRPRRFFHRFFLDNSP